MLKIMNDKSIINNNYPELSDFGERSYFDLTFKAKPHIDLAIKWDLAAKIWHEKSEIDLLEYLLDYNKNANIIDMAAGNGFHFLELILRGYNISALDGDFGNSIIIKKNISNSFKNLNLYNYNWYNLPNNIKNYDYIFCLGTSITYFDSWYEGAQLNTKNMIRNLEKIIFNFKKTLNSGGKLILGIANYYKTQKNIVYLNFPIKSINGIKFKMMWEIKLNWVDNTKNFICKIYDEHENFYEFNLISYLFDYKFLKEICLKYFNDVKIVNIENNLNDVILVCS